jgi:DNA-binding SARP family transcriptional activator/tetratricopeptide (TPR) repeat protein
MVSGPGATIAAGLIEFRLLGPFEVVGDGRLLSVGGRQQRALLAALSVHANELVPAERLIDLVWGGRPPPTAATIVQVYVSRLRKVLGRELVITRPPGYLLQVAPEQVDVRRAERLIAASQETREPRRRSALLRDALALWRGPALSDFSYDELGRAEAERLEELRLTALESAIAAELELGRHVELVPELEALVEEQPFRERPRGQLMLALYGAGRQADALSVYREGHRRLVEELGLDPSPSLRQLERRILEHDPTLDAPRPPGHSSPPPDVREERRSLTVLFAEVIMFEEEPGESLDPEVARRLLEPCFAQIRDELRRFGGAVDKPPGDTVVAVFGAPRAHEDHAERAVRAALCVLDRVTDKHRGGLAVRVGVSTGAALVRAGEAAFGPAFGRADRIRSIANPNAIVVDETTYRATREIIAYRRLEGASLWEALAAKRAIRTERPRVRKIGLVGRADELGLVGDRVRRVAKTHVPELVTIVGAPGIGKTRLLRELAARLRSSRTLWLQGRSIPYGDGIPYWAFAEAVKSHAGILDTDTPSEVETKIHHTVARAAWDGPQAVEDALRLLLTPERSHDAMERSAAFTAWCTFLERTATNCPLVLALEDIQWADDGLLDFVEHVTQSSRRAPLVVLCTTRPELHERRPSWASTVPRATTIHLAPLCDGEMRRLISALIDDDSAAAALGERVVRRFGGNPLFAEEYIRTLVNRGLLRRTGSGWRLEQDGEDPLPESVQGIIAARLDALPPDTKALLQDASVIGNVFWPGAVAAIGGRSRIGCAAQLEQLLNDDLVRRDERSAVQDAAQYTFKHALIRDVAYTQIPHAKRTAKHTCVAAWIESHTRRDDVAELMAHHYLSALEYADAADIEEQKLAERTIEALCMAAERARHLYANSDATNYLRKALTLLDQTTEADTDWRRMVTAAAQESLGEILVLTGSHAAGEAAFATAVRFTPDHERELRARLLRRQGFSLQLQRRIDDACHALAAAEDALGGHPLGAGWWHEQCEIAIQRLEVLYFGASLQTFVREFARVKPLIEARGTPAQRSSLFSWHAMVSLRRNRFVTRETTLQDQRAALAAALETGNTRTIAQKRFSYGFGLLWANRLEEAETEMHESLGLAEHVGDATTSVRCLNFLGIIERKRGSTQAAGEFANRALEDAQRTQMLEYVAQARATLSWVAWRSRDHDLAVERAQSALNGWDDFFQMHVFGWMPLWPLLGVALARKAEIEAVAHARTILDPTRQPMPPELEATLAAAVSACDCGASRTARQRFKQAAERATHDGYL